MSQEAERFKERYKKLESLKSMGIDPYGGRFEGVLSIREILEAFQDEKKVRMAGRLMAVRSHGKSAFCDVWDAQDRIQIYIREGALPESDQWVFELLDIGDIVSLEGFLFKTRTGEPTIRVSRIWLQAKSLRPLPEKWHGLKDVEIRYRQRYLDLASNREVREVFRTRSRILGAIRSFLDGQGYLEVETPMMQAIPGGAAGRPFKTHHAALDLDLYLRVAPELYLKRLLVGGFDKVYEINKSFRNEGISTRHNPEFTMLEVYTAYQDVEDVMKLTERLIRHVSEKVFGGLVIPSKDGRSEIDLRTWHRVSFPELMERNFGIHPEDPIERWIEKLKKKGIPVQGKDLSRTQLINIVADCLEPAEEGIPKGAPIFVTDYFSELSPLAKRKKDNPVLSERFELYLGGLEIANGYSELNNPIEQKERLLEEIQENRKSDAAQMLDEDFITALEHGMPPAGGLGIGIDRLIMVLCHQGSIRDVILFPQLRHKEAHGH